MLVRFELPPIQFFDGPFIQQSLSSRTKHKTKPGCPIHSGVRILVSDVVRLRMNYDVLYSSSPPWNRSDITLTFESQA
jgi:hypothetical protein